MPRSSNSCPIVPLRLDYHSLRRKYISELAGGERAPLPVFDWYHDSDYWDERIAIDLGLSHDEWKDLKQPERTARMEKGLERRRKLEAVARPTEGANAHKNLETADASETLRVQKKKRPGRRPSTDPAADRRIVQAWNSGQHVKYADLEREMDLAKGDVRRAIDRHRKRERLATE